MNTQSKTCVEGVEGIEIYYKERNFLIFAWQEIIKQETVGRDIRILTEHPIDNVYLNGKLLTLK